MLPEMRPASATFASVVLTLAAIVAGAAIVSKGEPVVLVKRSGYPPGVACVEQRLIIVRVESGRRLYINSEPLTRAELIGRLEEIFRTRAERVAFVLGGREANFGEVADTIGLVRRTVPNVGLLTPSSVPTESEPLLQWPRGAYPVKADWH